MQKGWLAKAGTYTVAQIPCPDYGGKVDLTIAPTGVLHTTEGSWDSALDVFKQHFAPHFLVGQGRIAQLLPLGSSSTALQHPQGTPETNRWARAQIEVAGFSSETPYSFDAKTSDALAALLATLADPKVAGIPLFRPFPDQMPPKPWASTRFGRRHSGKYGTVSGWYGHVEVPNNSHWDPGALNWTLLLSAARGKLAPPKPPLDPWESRSKNESLWRQWEFGEGPVFSKLGPRNKAHRPSGLPNPVPDVWKDRAILFLLRRTHKEET